MENPQEKTHILVAVSQASGKGYPHPSKRSREAFQWILENIVRSDFPGFRLEFLHVQPPNQSSETYDTGRQFLNYFLDRCNLLGIVCNPLINQAQDTKIAICSEVRRINPDILVMGSRRLGSSKRMFNRNKKHSSVSKYCMKHAECPVVTVNAKASRAVNADPDGADRN